MRVLIVANRLPVSITRGDGGLQVKPSAGGLATGLRSYLESGQALWIGWPGYTGHPGTAEREAVQRQLAEMHAVPLWLSRDEVSQYYDRMSNSVLWPLFHYFPERLPMHIREWPVYEQVNARFADAVAEHYQPGDRIWVHDYHLMLVPELLRARLPDATIGFFLHIPFPSSEVFRLLPFRDRLLAGTLGADLVGFHTAGYARQFTQSLLLLLGLATQFDRVQVADREVRVGVFPMGVDAERFAALAATEEAAREVAHLRRVDGCAVLVGIDRLDYTKGLPRRLLAYETLLRDYPQWRERVRLVQVAVPSRGGAAAYREFRQQMEALVGRVNGTYGTPRWAPIHYLHRNLSETEVAALYRAADVLLCTPLRDGMNLVAKEFVASRADGDGVLLLSEFAGAAAELPEAVRVNPYDLDRCAAAIHQALTLPPEERRQRMAAMRARVMRWTVTRWSDSFLDALAAASAARHPQAISVTAPASLDALAHLLAAAPDLLLLLDYDGTLVPFAEVPELARPDAALLTLLEGLARLPQTHVHLVSGRPQEVLERWFGPLPLTLHAEHGLWSRPAGGRWTAAPVERQPWWERVHAILEEFRLRTPGALVEEKTVSLAWHYRAADPEFGLHQANELQVHLRELLSNEPVEIVPGAKVIELRPHGVNKGNLVAPALAACGPECLVAAMGDDRTDEDLFAALPPDGVAMHVGPGVSRAGIRLTDWTRARRLLGAVLEARTTEAA